VEHGTRNPEPVTRHLQIFVFNNEILSDVFLKNPYLVIFTIGFPVHALGSMIFRNAATVGAISVISTGSDV
jgi:hypothetical protein